MVKRAVHPFALSAPLACEPGESTNSSLLSGTLPRSFVSCGCSFWPPRCTARERGRCFGPRKPGLRLPGALDSVRYLEGEHPVWQADGPKEVLLAKLMQRKSVVRSTVKSRSKRSSTFVPASDVPLFSAVMTGADVPRFARATLSAVARNGTPHALHEARELLQPLTFTSSHSGGL